MLDFGLKYLTPLMFKRLPMWHSFKESACQCRRCRFNPWIRKIPRSRKWQTTPVFLPGKSHGQKSLLGYSPWGRKRAGHNLVTKQQQSVHLFVYFSEYFLFFWSVKQRTGHRQVPKKYWGLAPTTQPVTVLPGQVTKPRPFCSDLLSHWDPISTAGPSTSCCPELWKPSVCLPRASDRSGVSAVTL